MKRWPVRVPDEVAEAVEGIVAERKVANRKYSLNDFLLDAIAAKVAAEDRQSMSVNVTLAPLDPGGRK